MCIVTALFTFICRIVKDDDAELGISNKLCGWIC